MFKRVEITLRIGNDDNKFNFKVDSNEITNMRELNLVLENLPNKVSEKYPTELNDNIKNGLSTITQSIERDEVSNFLNGDAFNQVNIQRSGSPYAISLNITITREEVSSLSEEILKNYN